MLSAAIVTLSTWYGLGVLGNANYYSNFIYLEQPGGSGERKLRCQRKARANVPSRPPNPPYRVIPEAKEEKRRAGGGEEGGRVIGERTSGAGRCRGYIVDADSLPMARTRNGAGTSQMLTSYQLLGELLLISTTPRTDEVWA